MFNKTYYDTLWQTVHRHDYCESLADTLIGKYGQGRYLDIGTGCGWLVKILRNKGCEAYGVDISPYAVENSHGNVLLGDIRNLPFADNFFDVVHSQGLWEYIPESDIQQAYNECLRVGKHQVHNIDFLGSGIDEENFATAKTNEWWNKKLQAPKILIGSPVHERKEYSLQRWLDSVKALTYPNIEYCMAFTGDDDSLAKRWDIPMIYCGTQESVDEGRDKSVEALRQKFMAGDYFRYFNLESDIICPPNTIEVMLKYGRDCDWISHSFTEYNGTVQIQQGIGCSMFTKKVLKDFEFKDLTRTYDAALWEWVRPQGLKFKTTELWNILDARQVGE